jgi:capsular polysaccharide transport system permease protein
MTVQAQQLLENKIRELRATLTFEQWADPDYLLIRVKELDKIDIALAFRLMQRVRNLAPTASNQTILKELRMKVLVLNPELAKTSSTDIASRPKLLTHAKGFFNLIVALRRSSPLQKQTPFMFLVIFPFLLFSFYQLVLASPRYESTAQLIVKEPNGMATLDPAMAIISGFGMTSSNADTELVKSYIHSNDMLAFLEGELNISEHFSDHQYDLISRLSDSASRESQFSFFLDKVAIEINEKSQVITIKAQAFDAEIAQRLSEVIVNRAEWYINEVGRNLAKNQLEFVQQEHALIQEKLRDAKSLLLDFQRRYNLLDPEAEGLALQQISYQLEGQVAAKKIELRALSTSMSEAAPLVLQLNAELDSLNQQLDNERGRLTDRSSGEDGEPPATELVSIGVGQMLAKYSDYKIDLELALQAYTSSLISLEKSRIEAYRQLKYLVVVETPTHPEEATFPNVIYNLALMLILQLMLFGIGKIILATVDEMK